MMDATTQLDPITFAVFRNGLISAANDMYHVFKRTTMLPVLYEYNDFGISLYDDRLNLIAEAPGLPIFTGSLDDCIARTLEAIGGSENLEPGDILINNHPYLTAGQPADAALIMPIYHLGRVVAYATLRAHMGDLGAKGPYPVDSTEIYQEGLLFPALKLHEAGELNEDIVKIAKANSRLPAETVGNILAGAGCLQEGARALRTLVDKYGVDTYYATVDELLEHGERIARDGIADIPDGTYTYEDYLDDDGVVLGEPVKLRCAVTVEGTDVTVDLEGSADQQRGPINCPWGYTLTTCRFALKRLVSPDIPPNGGEHRPLTVHAPERSVFNPVEPAPCFIGWLTSLRLGDMIVSSLASALPNRVPAEGAGDLVSIMALLKQPDSGRWAFFFDDGGTGHGAMKGKDGMSALIHPISAGIEYLPAEIAETRMPILRRRHELEQDSGGPGRWRGGLAATCEYEFLNDGEAVTACDKTSAGEIRGLKGGKGPPHLNAVVVFPGTDREMRLGKKAGIHVSSGDVVVTRPAGGGGYGDPRERDPEKVAWDVTNGYVSAEMAEEAYGVGFNEDGEVDEARTRELRSSDG